MEASTRLAETPRHTNRKHTLRPRRCNDISRYCGRDFCTSDEREIFCLLTSVENTLPRSTGQKYWMKTAYSDTDARLICILAGEWLVFIPRGQWQLLILIGQ